jgi:tetratricopeptide (TPR) repeat protein
MDSAPLTQAKLDALWGEIQKALRDSAWAQAEGLLRRMLQLVPNAPVDVWDVLAYALLMQGDYAACLLVLRPWSSDATRSFWVNHKLGDALRGLNQWDEAVDAYRMSLADGSDKPLTVRNLLQVLDALSPQRAVDQLLQWQADGPLKSFVLEGAQEAAVLVPGLELAEALFALGKAHAPCRRRLLEAACYSFDLSACSRLLESSRVSSEGLTTWEQNLQATLVKFSY